MLRQLVVLMGLVAFPAAAQQKPDLTMAVPLKKGAPFCVTKEYAARSDTGRATAGCTAHDRDNRILIVNMSFAGDDVEDPILHFVFLGDGDTLGKDMYFTRSSNVLKR